MLNQNEKNTLVSLRSDLIKFLATLKSSPQLEAELKQLSQLIATRNIPNTKKEKAKITFLLSLLFIGVYPELKTENNRTATIKYLSKLL